MTPRHGISLSSSVSVSLSTSEIEEGKGDLKTRIERGLRKKEMRTSFFVFLTAVVAGEEMRWWGPPLLLSLIAVGLRMQRLA